jgi:U3 small nucleolar RNA-associated protein 12
VTRCPRSPLQAEQLQEALAVYREEKVKGEEWEEECRAQRQALPPPKPHALLVAMGDITAERYVLRAARRIRSSELEEALLVMPFSDVVDFLPLLGVWIQRGWGAELACRCLLLLLRTHHGQVATSPLLLPAMDSLRQHTAREVERVRDMYGFNLAGLRAIQHGLETAGRPVFADISSRLQKIQRKKKLKTCS